MHSHIGGVQISVGLVGVSVIHVHISITFGLWKTFPDVVENLIVGYYI